MTSTRFPRTARVRARSDFDRIFKHGRRVALPVLALHFQARGELPGAGDARLGLAVSRKVDPHAVGRNRIKRVLRDLFRHQRAALAAGDYVVVARPGASQCDGAQLREALLRLLQRAGALPVPSPDGTMPAAPPATDSAPDLRPG
ncbi:MAG: ribonuclease P protein component [Proteobacteria bacterium]|nr:ribonuclease P protein component [Pseudomonadota bacterium]